MSYESTAEPIKLGYLFDFRLPEYFPKEMRDDLTQTVRARVQRRPEAEDHRPSGARSCSVRSKGFPKGTVKAVIDAYGELVDEGCLAIFGPSITDNAVPTREAIEQRFHVPAISVTGSEDWLGEWTFSFPQGSLTDEPIFWAHLLAKGGHTEVGVLVEQSLVGESYLKSFGSACRDAGIRIVAEERIAQTAQDVGDAIRKRARSEAERARPLRLRLRHPARQRGARGARLGPAPLHEHRVPERVDQPRAVECDPGMDRDRPVRRGQPRRPALPRPVRGGLRAAPAVLRTGGEPRHRHRAPARLRRRPSVEPPRREGGARAGEDASRRVRRTRDHAPFGKWSHRAWMGAGYLVARRLDPDGINSHLVDRFGED